MPQTLRARYTTDPPTDTTPTWVDVTSYVRAFSTSRGRDSELSRVEAGTAKIVVDNRDRTFDPTLVPLLRPGNRWELTDTVTGETMYVGYARSYQMEWPDVSNVDAITVVDCVDLTKQIAIADLPLMDPAAATTYKDVIEIDGPQGYWQMQGQNEVTTSSPTIGPMTLSTPSTRRSTAILGDNTVDVLAGVSYGARSSTSGFGGITGFATMDLQPGWPGDATGLSALTYEQWFKSSEATPAADRLIAEGPFDAAAGNTWALTLTTTGKIKGHVRNAANTMVTATGATSIAADTWYHIALVYNGANVLVYLNGVQDASAAQTGAVRDADPTGLHFYLGLGSGSPGGERYYDEVAWYRYAVPVARLLAHYEAGALRGFPVQDTGARISAVLAAWGYAGTTHIDAGNNSMPPVFQHGQSVLEEIRRAEEAEGVDAFFFIDKDGAPTFLEDGHRSTSPYNTIQAVFDDDTTDLSYTSIAVDYSDSFLANEITLAREGGANIVDSDAGSIADYDVWPLSKTGLQLVDDADVTAMAAALLAKYRVPATRITGLSCNTSESDVATAVLALDLGARVQVLHTQPNGGRIVQTCFVQRIQIEGRPGTPWIINLGLEAIPTAAIPAGSFRGLLALLAA